ncbi:MAG: radical SAM family heme chaperone HemW [Bacteroidetes bacterium]|nr:radical SAM family heme chaperone HemW [Bacteroidota bacterium]
MPGLSTKPGSRLGAYLHIPFCDTKCVYCDFYSLTNHDQAVRFYKGLKEEIRLRYHQFPEETPVSSVFFGGGTPSLADPEDLGDCIRLIRESRRFVSDPEITLEANPGTLNRGKLDRLLAQGFNRISMGVQSFSDQDLRFLSRIHSAETAETALREAFSAGFSNISADLIFGLPGQTPGAWKKNLERAVSLPVTHLSCYHLIVEEKTPLHAWVHTGKVQVPDEDLAGELYEMTIEFLADQGFVQYEVSNFCRPGFESLHNSGYWSLDPWMAFGPSAHGFLGGSRYKNVRNLQKYLALVEAGQLPGEETETLTNLDLINEKLMMGVRTTEGVRLGEIWQALSPSRATNLRLKLDTLEKKGYLNWSDSFLKATPSGLRFGDGLAEELFLDSTV